jgi:hypothetical protein
MVQVVNGAIRIAPKDEYVFFNPNTSDEVEWKLVGSPGQTLVVTFEDPLTLDTYADPVEPKTKRRLKVNASPGNCETHKYTISIDPAGVALDPVIIIRN